MKWLSDLIARLQHVHEWEFAGIDYSSKEGKWYWHIEECRWCDKRRSVLNNSDQCACGGNPNVKQ
jgi:hypothetical protein